MYHMYMVYMYIIFRLAISISTWQASKKKCNTRARNIIIIIIIASGQKFSSLRFAVAIPIRFVKFSYVYTYNVLVNEYDNDNLVRWRRAADENDHQHRICWLCVHNAPPEDLKYEHGNDKTQIYVFIFAGVIKFRGNLLFSWHRSE